MVSALLREPRGAPPADAEVGDGVAGGVTRGGGAALSEPHLRWLIAFVSVHLRDHLLQGAPLSQSET